MRAAFEEAEVDAAEIERLEPAMTNDEKDRHVLAAAVAVDSELIVTFDLDDFPPAACEPLGVEATDPDDFLLDLHDLDPEGVHAALEQQAADLNAPWPLDELLRALATAGVPRFATPSMRGASLGRDATPQSTDDGRPTELQGEACRSSSSLSTGSVGDRSWDRFADFRGGSGSFKGTEQRGEKPANLQGRAR